MGDKEENHLLREAVKRIIKVFNVKAIILFGSRARGDWGPWSDYDLLIIGDFRERYLDRLKRILDVIGDIPIPIEPHPYTMEEALNMLRRGNPTIADALEEGVILYSTKDLELLMEVYRELKRRGMRRTETTIIVPSSDDSS